MRGQNRGQLTMLATVTVESFVPAEHPIRPIKAIADRCLANMDAELSAMYAAVGRPSIPPERLLKGQLLIALFSLRGERQLCEQLGYNMMFRWFLDMEVTDEPFAPTVFSKNRDRLLEHDIAAIFFSEVVGFAGQRQLLSRDHFTVDGTLIEAWASHKSLRRRDGSDDDQPPADDPGNPTVDFRGELRSNDTHVSKTDPDARLARKGNGKEARLSYAAFALMENSNGLLLDLMVSRTDAYHERSAALEQLAKVARHARRRPTVAGDKGYDTRGFVQGCRAHGITPHVAQAVRRSGGSAIDRRTTRHAGYAVSQRVRKRIEEIFGWLKTVGGFRRTRYKGRARTQLAATLAGAAYNLVRLSRLVPTGG
jgi:transposase